MDAAESDTVMQPQKTPQARLSRSANAYIETTPSELRWLGASRMQFESPVTRTIGSTAAP
jgi:hypothetical protein